MTRYRRVLVLALFLGVLSLSLFLVHQHSQRNRLVIRNATGVEHAFTFELADTPLSRERGLMGRERLAEGHGMLFLFETPVATAFWMKDTPLSLDLLFFDAAGVVVRITPDTVPFSEVLLPSGGPVLAVLEVSAGSVKKRSIQVGDSVIGSPFFMAE